MAELNNSFSEIAHIYQKFNNNDIYQNWVAFTLRHCEQFPRKALDVACGNGLLTHQLGQFTQKMIGIDYDANMIFQAQNNYPQENWQIRNMLDLSTLDQDFDLVTCYLDSLCFLDSEEEVGQAFYQIYQRLGFGGMFLCDVWTEERLLAFDGFEYIDSIEDATLIWQSEASMSESVATVHHHLIGFEREASSHLYRKIPVTLTEKTYSLETYLNLLQDAGFLRQNIEVYPDLRQQALSPWETYSTNDNVIERWCFKARKV